MEALGGLFLGNPLPDVLNNPRAFFDILGGKQPFACDAQRADQYVHFHGIVVLPLDLCTARCLRYRVTLSALRGKVSPKQ